MGFLLALVKEKIRKHRERTLKVVGGYRVRENISKRRGVIFLFRSCVLPNPLSLRLVEDGPPSSWLSKHSFSVALLHAMTNAYACVRLFLLLFLLLFFTIVFLPPSCLLRLLLRLVLLLRLLRLFELLLLFELRFW